MGEYHLFKVKLFVSFELRLSFVNISLNLTNECSYNLQVGTVMNLKTYLSSLYAVEIRLNHKYTHY